MIRVEAIETFSLQDYDKLKNIQRKALDTPNKIYAGDTFECDEAMVRYLSGDNGYKKSFVKVIEILPIKIEPEDVKIIAETVNKTTKKKKASKK